MDGKETIGTPGGTTANDTFSNIVLASATSGAGNNFGELVPASLSGSVYIDANNDGLASPSDVLLGTADEPALERLEEGLAQAFGPVVLVRGVASPEAAVEAANASHYDGATSLAEAVIMAINHFKLKRRKIVM